MINSVPPIRPNRKIIGMSAILLPFLGDRQVDWDSLRRHIERTVDAGLIPAVNMDTGYAHLIGEATRAKVLDVATKVCGGSLFLAGAMVVDHPEDRFDLDAYRQAIDAIQTAGGTPIIFQSHGLTTGSDREIVNRYQELATCCDRFFAFELGKMFAPSGSIYSLEVFEQLMRIDHCVGAKHSSLRRDLEWERLRLRDALRPEFMVLTGNDLAIDMVMYGSDYLLGLSTFAPDLFAVRDAYWAGGDAKFFELNDILQYLGFFAFRNPTSAYKHSAAMFLNQRGWIRTSQTHPNSPMRPESDQEVLEEIGFRLGLEMKRP